MNRHQFEAKRRRYLGSDPAEPVLTEDGPLTVEPQEMRSLACVGQTKKARAAATDTQPEAKSPGSFR